MTGLEILTAACLAVAAVANCVTVVLLLLILRGDR